MGDEGVARMRGLSTPSTRPNALSPYLYGRYSPPKQRWWPLFACLGVGGMLVLALAIIVLTATMVTATMAAAARNGTLQQLQKNCENLAAERFRRESANDEDRAA